MHLQDSCLYKSEIQIQDSYLYSEIIATFKGDSARKNFQQNDRVVL